MPGPLTPDDLLQTYRSDLPAVQERQKTANIPGAPRPRWEPKPRNDLLRTFETASRAWNRWACTRHPVAQGSARHQELSDHTVALCSVWSYHSAARLDPRRHGPAPDQRFPLRLSAAKKFRVWERVLQETAGRTGKDASRRPAADHVPALRRCVHRASRGEILFHTVQGGGTPATSQNIIQGTR